MWIRVGLVCTATLRWCGPTRSYLTGDRGARLGLLLHKQRRHAAKCPYFVMVGSALGLLLDNSQVRARTAICCVGLASSSIVTARSPLRLLELLAVPPNPYNQAQVRDWPKGLVACSTASAQRLGHASGSGKKRCESEKRCAKCARGLIMIHLAETGQTLTVSTKHWVLHTSGSWNCPSLRPFFYFLLSVGGWRSLKHAHGMNQPVVRLTTAGTREQPMQ